MLYKSRVFRKQVHIKGSFVRCRDFKHCAQSKFIKDRNLGGSLLALEKQQTVKISPTFICILQIKNSPNVDHETMRYILLGH